MTALLAPVAKQLFLNPSTGAPASGFKLFTYLAGTLTKQLTYTDSGAGTSNTNPILLDSLGECNLWLTPNVGYKFIFSPPTDTDPPTNPIWTVDNIFGSNLTAPISPWAVAGGTPDAITATYSPPNASLPDGLLLGFRASGANTTTAPTFTPDAQPTYAITQEGGLPVSVGAIPGGLAECLVRFNLAHTRWELLNPVTSGGNGASQLALAINAKMSVTAASATATFTADFLTVATALGGTAYSLPSYSQAINLGTTGPGGMDTGSAPVSGFVSLYAIYNPTTQVASILACNSTTSTSTIYAGANLPAGYTASALIGTWPTDASRKFIVGFQTQRALSFAPNLGASVTVDGSYHAISLAGIVPPNAKTVSGYGIVDGPITAASGLTIAGTTGGLGEQEISFSNGAGSGSVSAPFRDVAMVTAQQIAVRCTGDAATLAINGYTF